ncbi:MAG: tRNA (N6-isopentenyl adenosine(37)-C2)-methylthiotransferase MiaB [Bdellovibrionales bacterium]|nr:tRNA (N6-isopentenyl adenosine(37)-C2)-methylthiotransferase MiaB [Bdellovibrionales bacterium]
MSGRIHISTYGCQMNDYESDRTYRIFHDLYGFDWIDRADQADLVLYNTCSIREKADHKAFSSIGDLKKAKDKNPEMIIAVGGCMAQVQGEDIQRRFPYVDLVFGTHQWQNLPQLVLQAKEKKTKKVENELFGWRNYNFLPYKGGKDRHPVRENISIQNGCNHFCSFCVVPFTRGREVSRPVEEIMEEVRGLADRGVKELNLLGQNVNAYGTDRRASIGFAQLLEKVSSVDGIERVRFVTSHPKEMNQEIVDAMANIPEVCHQLHLPIQSGSDRILEKMKREYTMDRYREVYHMLKEKIPDLVLTTDIIVGFPSETESEFQATLHAMIEFDFDDSFSFLYSPRPHTKAAQWTDEFIPQEEAKERLMRLQQLQAELKDKHSRRYLDQTVKVLVEGKAKKDQGLLSGKTESFRTVNFEGPKAWVGQMMNVKIDEVFPHSMKGTVVESFL